MTDEEKAEQAKSVAYAMTKTASQRLAAVDGDEACVILAMAALGIAGAALQGTGDTHAEALRKCMAVMESWIDAEERDGK